MAFEIEHDWQGDLATPRAHIGERVKTRLLILLSVIWVCIGLIGHHPWKPYESQSISIIQSMLEAKNYATPMAIGQSDIENPPLYYLVAAGFSKTFGKLLTIHDAARLANALWVGITLMMVGMLGRELWGYGSGRQTTLLFIGSLGLVVTAHLLTPQVAALCGLSISLYALALSERRPFRAALLLASGITVCFLSTGLTHLAIPLLCACLLPVFFAQWRNQRYTIVCAIAIGCALPVALIWPLLVWHNTPNLLQAWWVHQLTLVGEANHAYFVKTLLWYALPGLPIAFWGVWRYRDYLLHKPKYQLLLTFLTVSFIWIGFDSKPREIDALPLLLPIAVLAGGSIETLKRGAAGLLNWFGLMLFGTIAFILWLGWSAMVLGWPEKLQHRMQILSGSTDTQIHWLALLAALAASVIWLLVINNYKHSNRAAITDWAVGMTISWTLLMTLWLPWIDSARSYEGVMRQIEQHMPKKYACLSSKDLGDSQAALLHYYTHIKPNPIELSQRIECDVLLIQDERGKGKGNKIGAGADWKLLWEGKRDAYTRESFRLYHYRQ